MIDESEEVQAKPIEMLVDFYGFNRYVQEKYFRQVWLSNHEFLTEMHIHSRSFFKFLIETLQKIPYPENFTHSSATENMYTVITTFPNSKNLTNEESAYYSQILDFAVYFTNKIVIHSNESGDTQRDIQEFQKIIRNLIDIVPRNATVILEKYFLDNPTQTFEILLNNADINVRKYYQQMVAYLIFTATEQEKFRYKEGQSCEIEQKIASFIMIGVNELNGKVSKFYSRFDQYLCVRTRSGEDPEK